MTSAPPLDPAGAPPPVPEAPQALQPLTPSRAEPRPARPPRGGLDPAALGALYVLSLRHHLHGKRWVVAAALFLLPAALAVLVRSTAPDVPRVGLEFGLAFLFIPQALLPLVALLYASGMIQDEQEEQTITYLLVRPIPRWALYCFKLLATLTTTVVLTAVFTALTFAAIYLGGGSRGANVADAADPAGVATVLPRCLKAVSVHALAVVAYCCLFGLMSLWTKRTLVVGIVYAAIFEGLLANLPLSVRLITVIYYTRVIAYRTMDFVVRVPPRGTHDIAAEAWRFDPAADPGLLEHPRVLTCVAVLLAGSLVCTLLAALLCSRREFHVKTPEKS